MVQTEVPNRQVIGNAVIAGLVVVLVISVVIGFNALFQPFDDDTDLSPETACTETTVAAGQRLRASQVTVSVFNASDRQGLANQTLAELLDVGFISGDSGNTEGDESLRFVQIWGSAPDDPAARLVARQFGTSTVIRPEAPDLSPGVDVVLGDGFRGLVQAPTNIRVREPVTVCIPND